MTNQEVAEAFARMASGHERVKDISNSNGTFFIRDWTIYSYGSHYPIAELVEPDPTVWDNPTGRARYDVQWHATECVSKTTSRHCNMVRFELKRRHVTVINQ